MRPRYYALDGTIYDENDGMPVLVVNPQKNPWTAEHQRVLDLVLKALNDAE